MNRVLVVMLLAGAVAVINGNFLGNTDTTKIAATLKNPDAVAAYDKCIRATPEEAKVICDKIGNDLRDKIPQAIKANGCPATCTDSDKGWVAYILREISTKYPAIYEAILTHFKIAPEQKAKIEEFIKATPPPAGV